MFNKKIKVIGIAVLFIVLSAIFIIGISNFGMKGYPPTDYKSDEGFGLGIKSAPPKYLGTSEQSTTNIKGKSGGSDEYEDSLNIERKVIKTADLSLEVDDVQLSFNQIMQITQNVNGFVQTSSINDLDIRKTGIITIRVPENYFNEVINQIEKLGKVTYKQISGEDVTEEFIDLNARLNNSKRQEKRLLEILDDAKDVSEVLEVEKELERVRGEIERITGRLKYLNNKVDLSTIRVNCYEPEPIIQSWGIIDAIRASINGFILTVNFLIVLIGYLLPIMIVFIIIFAIVRSMKYKNEKSN
ncbi:MAG: DUF4349 domain-containing protein [Methanosarcinales archaeon]